MYNNYYYTPFGYTENEETIKNIMKYAGWKYEDEKWIALGDEIVQMMRSDKNNSKKIIFIDWRNQYCKRMIHMFEMAMRQLGKYPTEIQSFESLVKGVKIGDNIWQIKDITLDEYCSIVNEKNKKIILENPNSFLTISFAKGIIIK